MSQQFCLKWNNHMNNMMDVFKNLLSTEAMVDVTLACDGLSLKAHKIVLSACSPFFQSLFLENPCKHPIVILKDMKYAELKAIVEFMYHGEVNVAQDQLSALMKTAETLRVKGLAEVTNEKNQSGDESSHKSVSRASTPPPKRRKCRTRKRSVSDQSDNGISEPKTNQPDSDIEELSSDMNHNTHYSTASTVSVQSHTSNFHKSRKVQQQEVEETFVPEENYSIETPKLLQQTLTADDLPARTSRSSVQSNLELFRRSQSNIDQSNSVPVTSTPISSNALVVTNQQSQSPPDIKPEIFDLEPSVSEPPTSPPAGPSHSTDENSMMFIDQSNMSNMSAPNSFQEDSALMPTDSQQPQETYSSSVAVPFTMTVYGKKTIHQSNESTYNFQNQREKNRFDCIVCDKSFKQKGHLKRHFAVHSGSKPYVCPICGKNFSRKDVMRTHQAVHMNVTI